jgi:hypothetical protein
LQSLVAAPRDAALHARAAAAASQAGDHRMTLDLLTTALRRNRRTRAHCAQR